MDSTGMELTPGALTALALELLKSILRWKYFFNDPEFDFPPKFYYVAIPVLNVLMLLPLAFLLPSMYPMPTNWLEYGRYLLLVFLNSLVSVFVYNTTLKPTKVAFRAYRERKQLTP